MINKNISRTPLLVGNNQNYNFSFNKKNYKKFFLRKQEGENNTFIISIGINNYIDKGIKSLNYAEKDSEDIAISFSSFYKRNIYKYSLVGEKATKKEILSVINKVSNLAKKDDTILFYFSGHGSSLKNIDKKEEIVYIFPYDGNSRVVFLNHSLQTTLRFHNPAERKINKSLSSSI